MKTNCLSYLLGVQTGQVPSHLYLGFLTYQMTIIVAIFSSCCKNIKKLYAYIYKCYVCVCAQSCLTLCDPMDCSPPGFFVHGISQARILELVAISSRGSSQFRDQTLICCTGRNWQADSLPLSHQGSPRMNSRPTQ